MQYMMVSSCIHVLLSTMSERHAQLALQLLTCMYMSMRADIDVVRHTSMFEQQYNKLEKSDIRDFKPYTNQPRQPYCACCDRCDPLQPL